jgi:hypothetical protein
MSKTQVESQPSTYYTLDLTRPELNELKYLIREAILDNHCPERARNLDYLFNTINAVDRKG